MQAPTETEVRTLFARHALRCTRQRVDVYRALAATDQHPTAEELFWQVRQQEQGLSLATVYNALEAFCTHGLCRKLPVNGCGARFDADLRNHPHVVTSDGRVVDVPPDLGARLLDAIPRSLLSEVEQRVGGSIQRVRLELDCDTRPNA